MGLNQFTVFAMFFLLYFLFIWKAGKIYPIVYLFLFVYFVQYVFSVYLIYNEYPVLRREMPISQDRLFEYTLPALLFLFGGVFLFNKDVPLLDLFKRVNKMQAVRLGHLLVIFSYLFDFLPVLGVPGINSILSFTYYLKFIGAMCYLFAPSTLNYILVAVVYVDLANTALRGGVFIDFFVWCTYLFLLFSLQQNLSLKIRAAFIVLAVPLLVIVQSVKDEYRSATWSGKRETGIGYFSELAEKKQAKETDPFAKSEGVVKTVGRLNQGWHLGKVLKWVPKREDFSDGEDMLGDIEGTLLPRVLFPTKKFIGSQDKFHKYTGYRLIGTTSMTIGVLGDFYINYGYWGSMVGLFIFGALISRLFFLFMRKYVIPDPVNIVWIPFLFSYLMRANNDFYIVFNNLVKGFLIFLFISFLRKQFWPEQPAAPRT